MSGGTVDKWRKSVEIRWSKEHQVWNQQEGPELGGSDGKGEEKDARVERGEGSNDGGWVRIPLWRVRSRDKRWQESLKC